MWRLNVQLNQYESCVKYMAYATKEQFAFERGDILLFQITKNTSVDIHGRIPCFMYIEEIVKDSPLVVDYWGEGFREYKYLIKGERLTFIKPFSLTDVQSSNKQYDNQKNANKIHLADKNIVTKLLSIVPASSEDGLLSQEGDVTYKWHKQIERNPKNVEKIKKRFLRNHGKYFCEICKFDFQKAYGYEFIECHHRKPLSELEKSQSPNIADFALVCSNCHSVIHRERKTLECESVANMAKVKYIYSD